ncbi:sulfotransferase domain protein, partial [Oesophagostomum dentatum]
FALVPEAKIVVILYDPSKRAYSWYQHILSHNDSVALSAGSLNAILDAETPQLRKIRQRCISGGRYTHHLDRWLEYYPLSNLILIDGERLREEPAVVLAELNEKLGLPFFDYASSIRYSSSKRFFCRIIGGKTKCLGGGKGRVYPPMSPELWSRLNDIFLQDNTALHKFLVKNRLPVPKWLQLLLEG